MANKSLRDFIYLDVERVRSFVAQLKEGLPSESSRTSEHQTATKGSAEGGLPFIAKVTGEVDYHYTRSNSETRSLHDYIFEELFRSLKSENLVFELETNTTLLWSESNLKDGNFIQSSGIFKFIDYQHTMRVFQMSKAMFEIAKKSVKGTGKERQEQVAAIQRQATEFGKLPIKEMSEFINMNYDENIIRVKLFPYRNDTTRFFIGNAERNSFRYSPVDIRNTYGAVVDAGWSCLLQVNKGTKHEPGSLTSNTGNQLEDAFERMVETTATFSNLTHGVEFPAVAITLLAIYRERNY